MCVSTPDKPRDALMPYQCETRVLQVPRQKHQPKGSDSDNGNVCFCVVQP
jgi:hypothetical protein